jgi:hypothetical protein
MYYDSSEKDRFVYGGSFIHFAYQLTFLLAEK